MKQGCVIAPTLFNVYLCAILFERLPCGLEIDYRLDSRLFKMGRRLKANIKVTNTAVIDLQCVGDCAIHTHTAEKLHTCIGLLTEAY